MLLCLSSGASGEVQVQLKWLGILEEDKIYRGQTYGNYLCEWLRVLHSARPMFAGYPREICFLSGNNSYVTNTSTGERTQSQKFQNLAENKDGTFRGLHLSPITPIFLTAQCTFYSVGERLDYEGNVLQSFQDCQFICRRDMQMSPSRYCTLKKDGSAPIDLFDKLCYVETPPFSLTVSENGPMRERFEKPIEPGTYDTFAAAWALMLNTNDKSPLPDGKYRLQYGGVGRGDYKSDTVVDFKVQPGILTTLLGPFGKGIRQMAPVFDGEKLKPAEPPKLPKK
jgi:hypothetical protein